MGLQEVINWFNDVNGRLRISITPSCQLECPFCHTEGNPDHGSKKYMHPKTFIALLDSFEDINGKEINITGGEPMLHPQIGNLLDALSSRPFLKTVSTNGLALNKILERDKMYDIDQFKISLHTIRSDRWAKSWLGRAWNYEKLRHMIKGTRNKGYNVILNYTLSADNANDLEWVVKEAIDLNCDLKVIELEKMDHRPNHFPTRTENYFDSNFVSIEFTREVVSKYASYVKDIYGFVGCSLKQYKTPNGRTILIKTPENGKFHTKMCDSCPKTKYCAEGVFAIRVNTNGSYRPCILREDLVVQSNESYTNPTSDLSADLLNAIHLTMMGKLCDE